MASLRLLLVTCVAALSLVIAPGAVAIVNGSPDGNRHPYVVFVGENAPPRQACTGTLIAPRVVVTAAHCARTPGESMTVLTGEQALPPTLENRYTGVFTPHPLFCGGNCPGGLFDFVNHDVAVVQLDRDAPGPYAKLPRLFSVGRKFDDDLRKLTIVGYGLTAAPSPTAPPVGLGTRRYAKAQAHMSPSPFFLEFPVPTSSKYGTTCFADSGGPSLKGRTILAVTSIGDDACGGPSYAYRLDTLHARLFLAKYVDFRRSEADDNDYNRDEDGEERGGNGRDGRR